MASPVLLRAVKEEEARSDSSEKRLSRQHRSAGHRFRGRQVGSTCNQTGAKMAVAQKEGWKRAVIRLHFDRDSPIGMKYTLGPGAVVSASISSFATPRQDHVSVETAHKAK